MGGGKDWGLEFEEQEELRSYLPFETVLGKAVANSLVTGRPIPVLLIRQKYLEILREKRREKKV